MQETGSNERRYEIGYMEGVNALSSFNVAKKTELRHAENARSTQIGSIEKRGGQTVLGALAEEDCWNGNYGLFYFEPIPTTPPTNQGLYRISKVSPDTTASIYYLHVTDSIWTKLSGKGTGIITGQFDYTPAENCMFLVNHEDKNRYIYSDGVTVYDSSTVAGHLLNSPRAHRCNFYKGRLYLANYTLETPSSGYIGGSDPATSGGTVYTTSTTGVAVTGGSGSGMIVKYTAVAGAVTTIDGFVNVGSGYRDQNLITITGGGGNAIFRLTATNTDYKTSVIRSSYPMGLVALVNDDTTNMAATSVAITDNKYFYSVTGANTYDIYRGPLLVAVMTVSAVNESTLTCTLVAQNGATQLLASDEIWISGTYAGEKIMRWPKNPTIMGKDVKQYDSFKLAGGDNDGITMLTNIGNVLMVANKNSINSWNDYTLENFDLGIGNVSENGYVKLMGSLYFMHYTGVYTTTGAAPTIISNKVERYITGATKAGKEACAAGKKGRSVFFTLGEVTLYYPDGSVERVLEDVCLEYNLTQENWYVHTNIKASEFATFVSASDSDRLVLTDNDITGDMAVKEFLGRLSMTDDGKEIPFRIDFNRMTLNSTFAYSYWERVNNPIALLMDTERGSAMKVFVSMVEGNPEWYEVDGDVTKGLSVIKMTEKDGDRGMPPACRLLDVSVRDSSSQICRVNRATVISLPSNQDAVVGDGKGN